MFVDYIKLESLLTVLQQQARESGGGGAEYGNDGTQQGHDDQNLFDSRQNLQYSRKSDPYAAPSDRDYLGYSKEEQLWTQDSNPSQWEGEEEDSNMFEGLR